MSNISKFGAHKSGNIIMDKHFLKLILFKFLEGNPYKGKKKKNPKLFFSKILEITFKEIKIHQY